MVTDLDPYLAFANSTLSEAALRLSVPSNVESRVFPDALRRELERAGEAIDPRPEVAIQHIHRMRLKAIRENASEVLERWMEYAGKREFLRSFETIDNATFLERFLNDRGSRGSTCGWSRDSFPDPAKMDGSQVGLANTDVGRGLRVRLAWSRGPAGRRP